MIHNEWRNGATFSTLLRKPLRLLMNLFLTIFEENDISRNSDDFKKQKT